eukprot:TRINITY_DN4898_c0_g2_i4.p1 TRINITY_DN4898_c0_g2~~TRINITY_DN4898_c0_g2_i4.p1  ORF type:complete len:898 (+),score=268.29 TRINITY_DN4898_c0_g2_i4:45-2738(+)
MAGRLDLLQLQNLAKRDAQSYRDEVLVQWKHYQSLLNLYLLKPQDSLPQLEELIQFFSHVSSLYKEETAEFSKQIMSILDIHAPVLQPDFRKSCVQCLILLRNKGVLSNMTILPLFFKLFRCSDKALREMLFNYIVSDIKNVNQKNKNNKLNSSLQSFMYQMIKDPNTTAANKSLDVMVALYRKNIWKDAKTVNVIATACLSDDQKISDKAIQFFLNAEDDPGQEENSDDEGMPNLREIHNSQKHAKKTKKRQRVAEKMKQAIRRKERLKERSGGSSIFPALLMINDPQGLCEKLFLKLKKSASKFESRIHMMNLVSRLISTHKLFELNFYPYMQKYLQPHQKEITLLLAIVSQACHDLVPPDVMEPVIKCIADNFVSDRCTPAAMAIGLNTIREICLRCPLCMNETLLHDLAQYKHYKDKSVSMAARSLITVFRALNPTLLHKKDRGREAASDTTVPIYGQQRITSSIAGIELLNEEDLADPDDEEAWKVAEKKKKKGKGKKKSSNADEDDENSDDDDDESDIEVPLDSDEEIDLSDLDSDDFEVIGEGYGSDDDEQDDSGYEDVTDEEAGSDNDDEDDEDDEDDDEEDDDDEEEEVKQNASKKGTQFSSKLSKMTKFKALMNAQANATKSTAAKTNASSHAESDEEYEDISDEEEEEEDENVQDTPTKASKQDGQKGKNDKDSKQSSGQEKPKNKLFATSSDSSKPEKGSMQPPSAKKAKVSDDASQGSSTIASTTTSQTSSLPLEATRFLTPRDFELLKKRQKKQKLEEAANPRRSAKRKLEQSEEDSSEDGDEPITLEPTERVGLGEIEPYRLKVKRTLQDRLASVERGREGREKFGHKNKKGGGSSNKEKLKSKPFMLQKQKREIREKHLRSSRDKQKARKAHFKRMKSKMK